MLQKAIIFKREAFYMRLTVKMLEAQYIGFKITSNELKGKNHTWRIQHLNKKSVCILPTLESVKNLIVETIKNTATIDNKAYWRDLNF